MTNLTQHPCAGKCPEFKQEQCKHCLVEDVNHKRKNMNDAFAQMIEEYVEDALLAQGEVP